MKRLLLISLLSLTACTSPAVTMTQAQVASLSNQQLCDLKNTYPYEQKTEVEIGRRNLNCDPVFNYCRIQGIEPNTPAMGMCIRNVHEQAAMEQQIQIQQSQLQAQESRQRLERASDKAWIRNQAAQGRDVMIYGDTMIVR